MSRLITEQGTQTSPFVWLVAIACALLAIAVIITGIFVLAIYIIYQPRTPYIKVVYANLTDLQYDQLGILDVQMVLNVVAENDNKKAHSSFSDERFLLKYHGIDIAVLQAGPFDVPKNSSYALSYTIPSSAIPLDEGARNAMDADLKQGIVTFNLNGQVRARWKVGIFLSLKVWSHLSCPISFNWSVGNSVNLDCSSRSH